MSAVKEEVKRIAEELPESATWHDVMEQVYLKQVVETGLKAAAEGRVRTVEEVRMGFGLPASL
jgi:hypothetical protein